MQLIEHLKDLTNLLREAARVLKNGGRIYFETPHPKSLTLSSSFRRCGRNLYREFLRRHFTRASGHHRGAGASGAGRGLEVVDSGISRNWLFAATWPLFMFLPSSRKRFTARLHWIGWSACLVARRSR